MRFTQAKLLILLALTSFALKACSGDPSTSKESDTAPAEAVPQVVVPAFNADSAYYFIERQVEFGPRVPNLESHVACGDWLVARLSGWADEVIEQKADLIAFDGTVLKSRNIIASFDPENSKRVMLCAHWDTRPFADHDEDKSRRKEPIPGANDGGSGVGVLMEIARQLATTGTEIGIDIILFDAEDYGQPRFDKGRAVEDSYCLGSQHWASRPHKKNYTARYGILLDMVGAKNSVFRMEGYSNRYAPDVVKKVWYAANNLGYGRYFPLKQGDAIIDDHLYVNKIAGIPTIDIIHRDQQTTTGFGAYWHTHDDGMEVIDKEVLKAVGQTVMDVVYKER